MSEKLAKDDTLARCATALETLAANTSNYTLTITMQGNDTPATAVTNEDVIVTNPNSGVILYRNEYTGTVAIQLPKGTIYSVTGTANNPMSTGLYSPSTVNGKLDSNTSITITYQKLESTNSLLALQTAIQANPGKEILPIGTSITIPWSYKDSDGNILSTIQWEFKIMNWRYADCLVDGTVTSKWGCDLLARYCHPDSCQFDAVEGVIGSSSTHPTAVSGYYYYATGSDDTETYPNGWLTVEAGDTLPYDHYASIKYTSVKDTGMINYGYNNYKESGIRKYINANAAAGTWWSATHVGDIAPNTSGSQGLLYGFTANDLTALQYVYTDTKCNTVTDSGRTDIVYDRMYIPSAEEVYGIVNTDGQLPVRYWHDYLGLESQSNNATPDGQRKIGKVGATTSYQYCWLRSANRGNSNLTWYLFSSGYLNGYSAACDSYGVLPACFIA